MKHPLDQVSTASVARRSPGTQSLSRWTGHRDRAAVRRAAVRRPGTGRHAGRAAAISPGRTAKPGPRAFVRDEVAGLALLPLARPPRALPPPTPSIRAAAAFGPPRRRGGPKAPRLSGRRGARRKQRASAHPPSLSLIAVTLRRGVPPASSPAPTRHSRPGSRPGSDVPGARSARTGRGADGEREYSGCVKGRAGLAGPGGGRVAADSRLPPNLPAAARLVGDGCSAR